jgi:hypothetical protein
MASDECDATSDIKVGDRVCSYDFDGRDDCYVEGTVVGFAKVEGCSRYRIRASLRVIEGVAVPFDEEVLPPVNGTPRLLGGVCNGVRRIDRERRSQVIHHGRAMTDCGRQIEAGALSTLDLDLVTCGECREAQAHLRSKWR